MTDFGNGFFTQTPAWIVGLVTLLLLIAAYAIGTRIHAWRKGNIDADKEKDQDGLIVSSVFGLLALLLGFTFGLAVDRFDTRRTLVIDEANAIGTTYLRAQTFAEPHRSEISGLLAQYVDVRLVLAKTTDLAEAKRLLGVVDTLQAKLWSASLTAIGPQRDDVSAAYMESMNETIDLAATRKAGRLARVPSVVFTVLLIYMTVSAGWLGYILGERWRSAGVLMVLMTLSLLLILDIDSPNRGGVNEDQTPMRDLKTFIAAHPSPSFATEPTH
jgi:hypothetical protein